MKGLLHIGIVCMTGHWRLAVPHTDVLGAEMSLEDRLMQEEVGAEVLEEKAVRRAELVPLPPNKCKALMQEHDVKDRTPRFEGAH